MSNLLDEFTNVATSGRAQQNAIETPEFADFWRDKDGTSLRPSYPFKPFLNVRFLSDATSNQLTFDRRVFDIPYNYIQNFDVSVYPVPRASLTLADKEFEYIERFSVIALTLFNEVIEKRSQGLWDQGPFANPSFCRIRWGWEGVPRRISTDWISFMLLDFKYNITGTHLEIGLDLIGNSAYFFNTQKVGNNTTPVFAEDNIERPLYEYVREFLKRYRLEQGVHYDIPEEFDRVFTPKEFNTRTDQYRKPDTQLNAFIVEALKLQLTPDETAVSIENTSVRPDDENDFTSFGLIRRWQLKTELGDRNIVRVYEWRDTPTSIVQSLQAEIPGSYFLGYANLHFTGSTLDDNGNVVVHYVKLQNDQAKKVEELQQPRTTAAKLRFLQDYGIENVQTKQEYAKLNKQINLKLDKKCENLKEVKDYNNYITSIAEKDENGEIVRENGEIQVQAPAPREGESQSDYNQRVQEHRKETQAEIQRRRAIADEACKKLGTENQQNRETRAEAERTIEQQWDEYIRANTFYKPIDLTTGEEVDGNVDFQDRADRDSWILERLLNQIRDDAVLTINLTILGDPWLDGIHVNFANDKVRVIVNRPDGMPSLLTNEYFFFPNELKHTITGGTYTTSMTLKTSKEAQLSRLEETRKANGV